MPEEAKVDAESREPIMSNYRKRMIANLRFPFSHWPLDSCMKNLSDLGNLRFHHPRVHERSARTKTAVHQTDVSRAVRFSGKNLGRG